ncbi:MAG: cell division protein FtsA [Armatimonadota bacterium]
MPRHDIVTALEIGSSKICCLVGEVNEDKDVEIIGKGYSSSRGVKKGVITDIDEVVRSIEIAVMEAEKVAGFELGSVFTGVKNSSVASFNKSFSVSFSHHDKVVNDGDVKKLIDQARGLNLSEQRKIMRVVSRGFTLDGTANDIRNPVGMHGSSLAVDTHIITGMDAQLKNIAKVIKMSDLELDPEGLIFEPLATALSLLSPEEKDVGTVLIDIGAGTTDVIVYKKGYVLDSYILPIGGNHITYDIGVAKKVPLSEAERLKISYGCALADGFSDSDEQINAASFAYKDPVKISRNKLIEIVYYRLAEIFEHIKKKVDKYAENGIYLAGVVLTGGVALTPDIDKLSEKILELPARIGYPLELRGLTDIVKNPMYSAAVGLLLKGAQKKSQSTNAKTEKVKIKGYFQKLFNWLSEIF